MAEYYMILTTAGQAAYAQAGAGGSSVQISVVAVGDGGGVAVQPAESWTTLVHEVWRSAPALVEVVADNSRLVLVEAHVPYNVGGWFVREVGLLSPEGVLLAVGNHPESYKPALESGAGKELMLRLYIEHSNASQTTLKINPDIVMASCTYVLNAVTTHDASPTAHAGQLAGMNDHIADKANPHQVTAAQAGAEPAGAVAAHDVSPVAHAGQFAGVTGHMADLANPHQVTAAQAGAEPQGAVAGHNSDEAAHGDIAGRILAAVAGHNESNTAHADIRAAIAGIVIPTATEAVAGIIKQATAAQALAGTDNTTAMSPADVAAAIAGVVRGYTRQQHAMPVALGSISGAQAVDLDLHQELWMTAAGAIIISNPTNMISGKWCTLRIYAATAQTISWGSIWAGTSLVALPTAIDAGKTLHASFVCMSVSKMQLMGLVQGA